MGWVGEGDVGGCGGGWWWGARARVWADWWLDGRAAGRMDGCSLARMPDIIRVQQLPARALCSVRWR